MILYYREAKDGQILEEGITEAGSMASFTAAGTAYSNYNVPTIPFYMYYSMFGFQRIGDMVWAFADSRGKGFLMGGTAGRTAMLGEGLQHQDGHSLVLSSTVPTCVTYDPAYVFELAVVLQDGIRRMYQEGEDVFYYVTMYNEDYEQPVMPEGAAEGVLKGLYKFRAAATGPAQAQLFGSGPILNEALRAQIILAEKYGIPVDVWSVPSYTEVRREALSVERWNRLHPASPERKPHLVTALEGAVGPIIAASDYMKSIPDALAPWLNVTSQRLVTLGTDGFGRSDNREHLRRHFEVSAEAIAGATLSKLARRRQDQAEEGAAGARRTQPRHRSRRPSLRISIGAHIPIEEKRLKSAKKSGAPAIEIPWENPLIPNKRLRELYTAMAELRLLEEHIATLQRRSKPASRLQVNPGEEACRASTALSLLPGDVTSDPAPGIATRFLRGGKLAGVLQSAELAVSAAQPVPTELPFAIDPERRLLLAIGAALALASKKKGQLVLANIYPGELTLPEWKPIFRLASAHAAPILFVALPASGPLYQIREAS